MEENLYKDINIKGTIKQIRNGKAMLKYVFLETGEFVAEHVWFKLDGLKGLSNIGLVKLRATCFWYYHKKQVKYGIKVKEVKQVKRGFFSDPKKQRNKIRKA
jgi:hypothetical protein